MTYKIIGKDEKEYTATSEQLSKWIAERRVVKTTKCQPEGKKEFVELSAVPELAALLPADKRYFHRSGNTAHSKFVTYGSAGGVLMGVFATDNPADTKEVLAEMENKRSGITEIDYDEYAKCAKKLLAARVSASGSDAAEPRKFPAGTKFYHANNANRYIVADKIQFQFEVYEQNGGVWMGILAAAKPNEISALEKLAADNKTGVSVMTEKEFNICVKKKIKGQSPFIQSLLQREVADGKAAPLAVDSEPDPVKSVAPIIPEGTAEALDVGATKLPPPS